MCNSGYTGNGVSCNGKIFLFFFDLIDFVFNSIFFKKTKDVNECSTNNGGCASNALCTNTVGSFNCACNTGYSGDGFTCTGNDFLDFSFFFLFTFCSFFLIFVFNLK